MKKLSQALRKKLLTFQQAEINEYHIYKKLAGITKNDENRSILNKISIDELKHYNIWKKYTGVSLKPNRFEVWKYYLIARIFGLTFGVKLMEKGEANAQVNYSALAKHIPDAKTIEKDENEHEKKLINILKEDKLNYVGSIVLGMNDALVELTGVLAGLTLAFAKTPLIAVAGLVTGVAASLSMASSEYLSRKADKREAPIKAALYTGIAYFLTVFFLIIPFLVLKNPYVSFGFSLFNALIIIIVFNYYVSIAKDLSFKQRFMEMTALSFGVAAISFVLGYLIRLFFNIEV